MTLQEFVNKWNGRRIDFDGSWGYQCIDLYRMYVKEVLQFPQSPSVIGAKDVWTTYLKDRFERIKKGVSITPKAGDIVIWTSMPGNSYGHIAVALKSDNKGFISLDQNFPLNSRVHQQYHDYSYVLGWLRKRGTINPVDYKALYEKEVSDHKETQARERVNYDKWQLTLDEKNYYRDEALKNYNSWQGEIEARHKVEEELKKCLEG